MSKLPRRVEQPSRHPYKIHKKNPSEPISKRATKTSSFNAPTMTTTASSKFLGLPKVLSRKTSQPSQPSQKLPALVCNPVDDFLSSDFDVDLELSFASTMSIHSPTTRPQDLTPETDASLSRDYTPMDISPAPQKVLPSLAKTSHAEPGTYSGRPRSGSNARLFGRDMSNERGSVFSLPQGTKSSTTSVSKRLQRAALPTEWLGSSGPKEHPFSQPVNVPPSPANSDMMDVDSSFVYVPSTSAPEEHPLSASPTITGFNFAKNPLVSREPASAAPTVSTFKNLFYETSPPHGHADASFEDMADAAAMVDESPLPHFAKKRRSTSPQPHARSRVIQALADEETSFESSPVASSPSTRKLERMASTSMLRKPLGALQDTLALNANKKRPRRPTLSATYNYGEGPMDKPQSAYPAVETHEPAPTARPTALPVRRAFSAMLPPSILEASMAGANESFESEGPDMSSPAQAYAKRQHVKTIRRCDGTEDFRPMTGASALVRGDAEALRKAEQRDKRATLPERDTPRSKYLSGGAGLGSFGDNEAHGKILPCHRVKEDGLMRVDVKTLDDLLDGAYDSHIASFQVIDCRFDYEYDGGHIPGAVNINTIAGVEEYLLGANINKPLPSSSGDDLKKTILIFHCEFSAKRAPTFAKHLRSKDRALNGHVYPRIHYPEVYILEGGYSQYYSESAARCTPCGYVQMDDPHYAMSRKEDLDHFRKNKFGRTKSYAYGEGKLGSLVSAKDPKRSSAPTSGSTTLFAAANAARTRRTGAGSALQMLAEDKSTDHHSDDDTDIGDSPCPPPSKTAQFKNTGKKLNRLSRAETYDSARMQMGY